MAKQNSYSLPAASIKAKSIPGVAGIEAASSTQLDQTKFSENLVKERKILENYRGIESSAVRISMREYYERGINILKPEIVMTHELIPIRKDFEQSPGLQVQAGDRKISVNQVFKLIELHHSVQNAMNISSLEFLQETAGFDIEAFYDAAFKYYNPSVISDTLEASIQAFKELIQAEMHPSASSQPRDNVNSSAGKSGIEASVFAAYGDADAAKTSKILFELETSGKAGAITKQEGKPKIIEHFPFRTIIRQGTQIQLDTINRILEIIILEKITEALFDYFADIVTLKEIVIPRYHDISKMTNTISTPANASLKNESKKAIQALKNNFIDSVEQVSLPNAALLVSSGNSAESQAGPFKFAAEGLLAPRGLGISKIGNSDNFTIIYSLFTSIMKSLTFNSPGKIPAELMEAKSSVLKSEIRNDGNGINTAFSEKIYDFFERTSLSSFIGSNSTRIDINTDKDTGYTNFVFTSAAINDSTINKSKAYALTRDEFKRAINQHSKPSSEIDRFYSKSKVLEPPHGFVDDLDMAGELLSAAIFDTCFVLNNRKYNTDSFGNGIASDFEQYIKNTLGHDAMSYIDARDFSGSERLDLDAAVQYSNSKVTNIENGIGLLGDAIFAEKRIVNNSISCLPGSNRNYPSLNKTLDGKNGIPLEAFSDASFDGIEEYIEDLENFTNKSFKDIGRLFGLHGSNDFPGQVTKSHDPNSILEMILSRLLNELDVIIDQIFNDSSRWVKHTTVTADKRRAFSLATAILAGGDDLVLSNFFVAHYLRKDGYFATSRANHDSVKFWTNGMRSDAACGALWHMFEKIMGKDLQTVSRASLTARDVTSYYRGNFGNYFLQAKSELADDDFFTFLNNSKFNGTTFLLGRELESDDFETWEKLEFKYKNNHESLLDPVEDTLRDSEYSIMTKPVESLRDFIKDKDSRYAGGIANQLNSENLVESESVLISSQPSTSGGKKNYEKAYILKEKAENPGIFTSHSLFKSTDLQREYATFAFICKLLNRCLTVKIKFNSDKSLGIIFSKRQLMGLKDAIRNTNELHNIAVSRSSIVSDADQDPQKALLELNTLKNILKNAKRPLNQRVERVKVCYASIYSHIENLHTMKEEIKRSVSPAALKNTSKLAIDYYGLKNSANGLRANQSIFAPNANSVDINFFNVRQSLLFYLSSKTLPMFYKNYYDNIQVSKGNFAYPSYANISDQQIYQMNLALSGEDFGNSSSEKLGKKTILNVGIPPGQLIQLGINAQTSNGDPNYFNSPYVCIHIFKKDGLGGDILYYPKPFIFNSNLVAIENFDSVFTNESSPIHEEEYESINTFEKLLEKFSLYGFDIEKSKVLNRVEEYNDIAASATDLNYMNNGGSGNKSIALREIKINHLHDHYLKMYMKMTTGINLTELAFPLNDHNRLTGQVDEGMKNLFDRYRDALFLRYPSINVDPVLAREFVRLEKNIAASRFFSLNEKVKNVFSAKAFERIYSVFVNEADFVVYPYPDIISDATKEAGGTLFDTLINTQAFVDSLPSLYEPCPYFNLNSGRQIFGINNLTKAKLAADAVQGAAFSNVSEGNAPSTDKFLSGKYRQFFKHLNEIESDNVSDVYEFFAVVSVIRRK